MIPIDRLRESHSTTRLSTRVKPDIQCQTNDAFQSQLFLDKNETRIGEGGSRFSGLYKNSEHKPLLTIITAVFNGESHLEETILSVLSQTYDNVELIIIDGGSNDGTLDILKRYEHAIDYWVSEPDAGISDAFNKGVQLATGTYINFQGDGDGFFSNNSLENVIQGVNPINDQLISGRIQRVCKDGHEMFISKAFVSFDKKSLLFRMSLPHQGLFTSLNYFKKYGLFDINNTYCMDYEHLLRAYHNFPKVVMTNVIVAKWRADGLGNNRDLDIFKEYHKIKVDNKVATYPVLFAINLWTLVKYTMKKLIK